MHEVDVISSIFHIVKKIVQFRRWLNKETDSAVERCAEKYQLISRQRVFRRFDANLSCERPMKNDAQVARCERNSSLNGSYYYKILWMIGIINQKDTHNL